MSEFTDELMKKLNFVSKASDEYMHHNKQRLTGQQRVLAILNLQDNLTQSYLQEILDLRPSSIAELVKKLEDKGYISRKEDENDKRIKHINLTEEGRQEAIKYANLKDSNTTGKFFQGLSSDEQEQFKNNLEKISDGWDTDFKEQAQSFTDPMDRMETMKNIKDEMYEKYKDNLDNMTDEDRENFHHDMHEAMKKHGIKHPNKWPMGMMIHAMPDQGFEMQRHRMEHHDRMGHHGMGNMNCPGGMGHMDPQGRDHRQNWRW